MQDDSIEYITNGDNSNEEITSGTIDQITNHINTLTERKNLADASRRSDDYEHPIETLKIVDGVLGENAFDLLYNMVTDRNTPWYYVGTTYGDNEEDTPKHYSLGNSPDPDTELGKMLEATVMNILDSVGIKCNNLYRIRLGLIYPNGEESMIHEAHIDSPSRHEVGLFYLTDSNGPTYIYKNKRDEVDRFDDSFEYYRDNIKANLELLEAVDCVANRIVMFNGDHYHASSTPTNVGRRITLNFNYD